jgi:hypothetical protein
LSRPKGVITSCDVPKRSNIVLILQPHLNTPTVHRRAAVHLPATRSLNRGQSTVSQRPVPAAWITASPRCATHLASAASRRTSLRHSICLGQTTYRPTVHSTQGAPRTSHQLLTDSPRYSTVLAWANQSTGPRCTSLQYCLTQNA